jgi:hypothetical protein
MPMSFDTPFDRRLRAHDIPAAVGSAEVTPQQADGSANAKGQPWLGRNERQTHRGMFSGSSSQISAMTRIQ